MFFELCIQVFVAVHLAKGSVVVITFTFAIFDISICAIGTTIAVFFLNKLLADEWIANAERSNHRDNVGQTAMLLSLCQHLAVSRRDWEQRHGAAKLGDLSVVDLALVLAQAHRCHRWCFESAQVRQHLLCLPECDAIRWCREGEVGDVVNVHRLHREHQSVDRCAQDLGARELSEVIFVHGRRVEAVAVTRAGTTRSTGSLRG